MKDYRKEMTERELKRLFTYWMNWTWNWS